MPDKPAEQATRRPRRTPHVAALEAELDLVREDRDAARRAEAIAARQHDADVGAILRATARAELAERLLAVAVNALGQWTRGPDGDLAAPAADALAAIALDVLGVDPAHRPPRIRHELAGPWNLPAGEHPDDDEPPIEP